MFSIKRRLILVSLFAIVILELITTGFIYDSTNHEIEEVYDARLSSFAKFFALFTPELLDDPSTQNWEAFLEKLQVSHNHGYSKEIRPYGHPYERNIIFQIVQDGKIILHSTPAPSEFLGKQGFQGYGQTEVNGEYWRYYQINIDSDADYTVLTAEKTKIRHELINEIALSTAVPLLVFIPIVAALLIFLINRFLRPLSDLEKAVSKRDIHKLDRIKVPEPTQELTPLVDELNRLLAQLEAAWQREKRFTRTAAHELKTPLAVLRLNAENALKADSEAERQQDLSNILISIDRTDRLIFQMLTLSKVESKLQIDAQPMYIPDILGQCIAYLAPLAIKNNQEISLDESAKQDPLATRLVDPILLESLFSNLIDNAIRYAGAQAKIEVLSFIENDDYVVQVKDTGAAISVEVREHIFEKFYRGHSERGDGAGLGMSIASDIAQLHQASLRLLPNQSEIGNCFEVRFFSPHQTS